MFSVTSTTRTNADRLQLQGHSELDQAPKSHPSPLLHLPFSYEFEDPYDGKNPWTSDTEVHVATASLQDRSVHEDTPIETSVASAKPLVRDSDARVNVCSNASEQEKNSDAVQCTTPRSEISKFKGTHHEISVASAQSLARNSDAEDNVRLATSQYHEPVCVETTLKVTVASAKSPLRDSDAGDSLLVASPQQQELVYEEKESEASVASAHSLRRDSDAGNKAVSTALKQEGSVSVGTHIKASVASANSLARDSDAEDTVPSTTFRQEKSKFLDMQSEVYVASAHSLARDSDAVDKGVLGAPQQDEPVLEEKNAQASVASADSLNRECDARKHVLSKAIKQEIPVSDEPLHGVSVASADSLAGDSDASAYTCPTSHSQEEQVAISEALVASANSLQRDSDAEVLKTLRSGGPRRNAGKGAKAKHSKECHDSIGNQILGKKGKQQSRVNPESTSVFTPANTSGNSPRRNPSDGPVNQAGSEVKKNGKSPAGRQQADTAAEVDKKDEDAKAAGRATPSASGSTSAAVSRSNVNQAAQPVAIPKRSLVGRGPGLETSQWSKPAAVIQEPPKENQGSKRKNQNRKPRVTV